MTETEWLNGTDPAQMLHFLRSSGQTSKRKLRLFACACCRHVWQWFGKHARQAIVVSERYADRQVTWEGLTAARQATYRESGVSEMAAFYAAGTKRWEVAEMTAHCTDCKLWDG